MKKLTLSMITVIIMTLGIIQNSNAQTKTNGLYLTFNDYVNHKLSYTSVAKGDKIAIHDFFESKNIVVTSNGAKQTFSKNEIFGYRTNNHDYRFMDNKAYQIVDTAGFYIYKHDKLTAQVKGPKPVSTEYFSKSANAKVLLLNMQNIDVAFASNYKFRNMVQAEFKNDSELNEYDSFLNTYKIKELYTESNK
jgi:hypothetical protein